MIVSGKKVELYHYEEAIFKNKKNNKRINYKKRTKDEVIKQVKECENEEFKMEVMRSFSLRRTRAKIIRLVDSNPDLNAFVTLTFKDNITDLREANSVFKSFIKRLKRQVKDLRYLAVPEFQKRGAVHYHVLVNFEMRNEELADIWGQGFVMINKIKHISRLGIYVSKYIGKDLFDLRYFGMRKILSSRNLAKPIIVTIGKTIKVFMDTFRDKLEILKEKVYYSDWLGKIEYMLLSG
jgi:hypothetical protein